VKATGAKVCGLCEGRDAAGKGGIIKAITARTSPRVFRVVALTSLMEREETQIYFQRYILQLPAGGTQLSAPADSGAILNDRAASSSGLRSVSENEGTCHG
jgi:hypothetical protein